MRYLLGSIIIAGILFLAACHNAQQKQAEEIQATSFKPDTLNPAATYSRLRDQSPAVIDTVYKNLFAALNDNNRFGLLHEHVAYYKKLSGDRWNAAALIAKSEGFSYNYKSQYDSSKQFYKQAITLYQKENALADLAECYYGQGMNYFFEGNYMEALNNNYKSLTLYEQLKDSGKVFIIKTEIANNLFLQRDYDKAFNTIMSCYNYYKPRNDSLMTAYCESILGKMYYEQKNYNKSLEYASSAMAIRKALGDQAGLSGSYNNIAAIHMALKQWDKALDGFTESLRITEDGRQIPIIKQNMANCLGRLGRYQEAATLLHEVIDSARQRNEQMIVTRGYLSLSGLYKQKGDYPAALEYYEKYKQYNDTLYTYEKEKAIGELQIKYETGKKEAEIARLNSEKKVDNTRKTLYLSISVFIVVIAVLVISILSGRNKKNRLILEKVRLELEANSRELYHFTENVISKNKLIEELELQLKDKEKLTATETNKEQLSELYQLKILTEDDWQNFKKLFDKVYPGLINRLREQYPELAPAEERQFLLTKLIIDNKESANMLGISVDSVKKNRYRLKKRFNLAEQESLDEFVWNFA